MLQAGYVPKAFRGFIVNTNNEYAHSGQLTYLIEVKGLYTIGGLDYWTGLLDYWTHSMIGLFQPFSQLSFPIHDVISSFPRS